MMLCRFALLSTLLLCYSAACEIKSFLPCYVRFGYVYFSFPELDVNAKAAAGEQRNLIFKATNIRNNKTRHFLLEDSLWDVEELPVGAEYHLRVFYENTNEEVWSYGNKTFKLPQDLFYCYYHKSPSDRKPRVFDITERSMGMQWDINFWDKKYGFIQYHEISAQSNGVEIYKERLNEGNCRDKICSSIISGLKPCHEYKACIRTKFTQSSCEAVECVHVTTLSCIISIPINYVVLCTAGGIFLLVIVICVTICPRLHRKKNVIEIDMETDDVIYPRDCHHYYEIPYVTVDHDYCQIHHMM